MELFVLIAFTHFIALISPGPDFFLLLTTLLRSGVYAARWVCVGIALGNALILTLIYMCLTVFGQLHPWLLLMVQCLGMLYLLYLAVRCIQAGQHKISLERADCREQRLDHRTALAAFLMGLQSSLFNPKNLLFYSSLVVMIYTVFTLWQHLLVNIWMVMVVLLWNLILLQLFKQDLWLKRLKAHAHYLYYAAAAFFCSFACIGFWALLN